MKFKVQLQKVGQGAYEGQWKRKEAMKNAIEKSRQQQITRKKAEEEKQHGCREVWKWIFILNKRKLA